MSSLIGKQLQGAKYKLDTVLGRGGFGLTFRARQTRLDQTVVIKTLNEDHWQAPNIGDLQQQFQDEGRRLAMCSHPNVVRVSDFFIEDGLPYMVMDYIPGRSLYDIVIPSNPLPIKTALSYTTQIGRALQAVHAKGLLHRDVKPQNIMIHELTGDAILIDFGIARELSQNPSKTHTSIVSEGYAPVEQYLPRAHRSAATDIYGLAATLYTLLTAEIPKAAILRDRDPLTPIQQLRPDVKPAMADAIACGMSIELRDRPQAVGPWLTILNQELSATTPAAEPVTDQPATDVAISDPVSPLSPSEYPTKVVAPAYTPSTTDSSTAQSTNPTVAVPIPSEYSSDIVVQPTYAPIQEKKGFGCLSFLGLVSLFMVGAFAAGGFWLYRQFSEDPIGILPPAAEVEAPIEPEESGLEEDGLEEEDPEEDALEEESDDTETEPGPEEEEDAPDAETEDIPISNSNTSNAAPPLVLADSGRRADAQPGDPGGFVPVPGFAPGTSQAKIRDRLGSPTRESARDGFSVSSYTLVPNRATLAYVYEPGSTQVRQSEAAFSPSVAPGIMRSTLVGMLGNRPPASVIDSLQSVLSEERDRVDISTGPFTGTIERNANGYIHIYVRQ